LLRYETKNIRHVEIIKNYKNIFLLFNIFIIDLYWQKFKYTKEITHHPLGEPPRPGWALWFVRWSNRPFESVDDEKSSVEYLHTSNVGLPEIWELEKFNIFI